MPQSRRNWPISAPKFGKAMDRATEALTIFLALLQTSIGGTQSQAQSQGNLEGVLAVETEMKLADKKSVGPNSKYEPLKNFAGGVRKTSR